ncbi:filamentous hemagglutinin N-terminal domain-containing protein [Chroococcus sp. FPU101]|uniref:two-partner secretion domain-containing protein n=1 Tax=Chroococcus sp. FPU101 TaxID=1974212 RepID=UPI001A8E6079|nr:filamentous hemagglutinin N-terminal domain-containing protein [Chroococcus sp. FPU101]
MLNQIHHSKFYKLFHLTAIFWLYSLSLISSSQAQVSSDGTLSTEVTTPDQLNFTVTGQSQAGGNLFHSFRDFSVPTGGSVIFDNAPNIQNIFSRVTGGSISNIDGLIKTQGNASLFLLNPHGIIFGSNAQIDIKGSFITSTATQINFADGSVFSATDVQAQPILTVTIPIGLQFREQPGDIVNRSIADGGNGLLLQSGQTLALIGGNVLLEGGILTGLGGRIEVGSVAAPALVSLTPIAQGWSFGYDTVQNFQDIQLSQKGIIQSLVLGTGEDIQLRGKRITLSDNSEVNRFNDGADAGGLIKIQATESLEVSKDSNISALAFSSGTSPDIIIETKRLLILNQGSFVDTATFSDGRGGNLSINATEFIDVNGTGDYAILQTSTSGKGDAGDAQIRTGRLIFRNGGVLRSSTDRSGNAGQINIEASDGIEIFGQGVLIGRNYPSGIFSTTSNPLGLEVTGNGGVVNIRTSRLTIQDGGTISVAAFDGSIGQAGNININALESVIVSGFGSSLLAESTNSQAAGNLLINTAQLNIQDGGRISVSTSGEGSSGNLQIKTDRLFFRNGGVLTSSTIGAGDGGQINIEASDRIEIIGQGTGDDQLFRTGIFSTTSNPIGVEATGNGGVINLKTSRLILKDGGTISVAAFGGSTGQAGNININALESVIVSGFGSSLLAESASPLAAGNLNINTTQLNIQDGGRVSVSASGTGASGNLFINASTLGLTNYAVLSADTTAGEGNITLQVSNDTILRNNSQITTNATREASGGNININTSVLVLRNSSITANSVNASGGRVRINTKGKFLTPDSSITARSERGPEFNGIVELNTPEIDPNRGFLKLPETIINPRALITQNPCKKMETSQLTITGRGGLPPNLNENLSSDAVQVDLVKPVTPQNQSIKHQMIVPPATPIKPAQGWIFNEKGEVMLTDYDSTVTESPRLPEQSVTCPADGE